MIKAWFLFLLGTVYYFALRYAKRSKKTVAFSFKYWMKDNLPEFITTLIVDVAFMVILTDAGTIIDISKFVPDGIILPGKLLFAFGIGAGLGKIMYEIFKKKATDAKG